MLPIIIAKKIKKSSNLKVFWVFYICFVEEKKGMFKFGDHIYVEFTDNIAKKMQQSHGGWGPSMESVCLINM